MNTVSMYSTVIILLVLSNTFLLPVAAARSDPYLELENWLRENLAVLGLTLYRGPYYDNIGFHLEPLVYIQPSDSRKRLTLNYTDFIEEWAFTDKYNLNFPVRYLGYEKAGPIIATWPSYNFTYVAEVDPTVYAWGVYLPRNTPDYAWYSSEADPYTINYFNFTLSKPLFSSNPEYLYSYVPLTNNSKLTLPKGENLILTIFPYNDVPTVFEGVSGVLGRDKDMPLPPQLSDMIEKLQRDDPLSSILVVTWEVLGNNAYLKMAVPSNYTHQVPCGLSFLAYVGGALYRPGSNETREQWYARAVETGKSYMDRGRLKVSLCDVKTPIFQPIGVPLSSYSTIVDLYNLTSTRAMASTAVFLIINPKVYSGDEVVRLTVSDLRGMFKLTYYINIGIGPEKFKVDASFYRIGRSDTSSDEYRITRSAALSTFNSISMNSKGEYDEDGCLLARFRIQDNYYYYVRNEGTHGYNYQDIYQTVYSNAGEETVKIGGWLPNPPPPGNVIEVDYVVEGSYSYNQKYEVRESKARLFLPPVKVWTEWSEMGSCTSGRTFTKELEDEIHRYELSEEEAVQRLMDGLPKDPILTYEIRREHTSSSYKIGLSGLLYLSNEYAKLSAVFKKKLEALTSYSYIRQSQDVSQVPVYYNEKDWGTFYNNFTGTCFALVTYSELRYTVPAQDNEYDSSSGDWLPSEVDEIDERESVKYNVKEGSYNLTVESLPALFILLDRSETFAGERLEGVIHSYGDRPGEPIVALSAQVVYNNTVFDIRVDPPHVKLDSTGVGSFTLHIPQVDELRNKLGELPSTMVIDVTATDARGLTASAIATLHVSDDNLIIDFMDVDMPVPEDPSKTTVLGKISPVYWRDFYKPLRINTHAYIESYIVEKSTGRVVEYLDASDGRAILDVKGLGLKEDETYTIKYTLKMDLSDFYGLNVLWNSYGFSSTWVEFSVPDVGVDIRLSDFSNNISNIKIEVPVPYSLFKRYYTQSAALAGKVERFKLFLADQAIPTEPLRQLVKEYSSTQGGAAEGFDAYSVLSALLDYMDEGTLSIGPKVVFPVLLTGDAKGTVLEVFEGDISFRDPRLNLTYDALKDPDSYWSKLAKLVTVQSMMLKTYAYAETLTLMASKILSLAITLETFKGYFSFLRMWNRQNLFAYMSRQYKGQFITLPSKVTNAISVAKIGALTLEGGALNLMALTNPQFGMMSALNGYLLNVTGSKESANVLIATSFKLIRFLSVMLISKGDLVAEFGFEVMFQLVSWLIAHALMFTFNLAMQLMVLSELESGIGMRDVVSILPRYFLQQYKTDVTYARLAAPIRERGGASASRATWDDRVEKVGAAFLGRYSHFEEGFFKIADLYRNYLEPVTSMVLSTLRGLDGMRAKLFKEGFASPEGVLRFMNMPVKYTVQTPTGVKEVSTRLNDVLAKLYLAFTAFLLTDMLVKIGWNYGFYYTTVYGDYDAAKSLLGLATFAQILMPFVTALLVARVPVGKASVSASMHLDTVKQVAKLDVYSTLPIGALIGGSRGKYSSELSGYAQRLSSMRRALAEMMLTSRYDVDELEELSTILDEADKTLLRAAFHVSDPGYGNSLYQVRNDYLLAIFDVYALLNLVTEAPSLRPSSYMTALLEEKLQAASSLLEEAASIMRNAESSGVVAGKVGAAIVVRQADINVDDYPLTGEIEVVVNNLGDAEARVKLVVLETDKTSWAASDYIQVQPTSSAAVKLRVPKKPGAAGYASPTLAVYVNGELVYELTTVLPIDSGAYSSATDDAIVVSDGPVSIHGSLLTLVNSTLVLIMTTSNARSFRVALNDRVVRSGVISLGNRSIVSVVFRRPISGTLTYRPIQSEHYFFSGTGEQASKHGFSIYSSEFFSADVHVFRENPYPETRLSGPVLLFLAVDLVEAKAGYATLKIRYEDLGIRDPSIIQVLKYSAVADAYVPIENYVVNPKEKTISITIAPGDPVIALTTRTQATTPTAPEQTAPAMADSPTITTSTPATTPTAMPPSTMIMAVVMAIVVAVAAMVLIRVKKRASFPAS